MLVIYFKMAVQSLGNREFLAAHFSQILNISVEAKIEKSKTTIFSQTFEVAENKVTSFFLFVLKAEILTISVFNNIICN